MSTEIVDQSLDTDLSKEIDDMVLQLISEGLNEQPIVAEAIYLFGKIQMRFQQT